MLAALLVAQAPTTSAEEVIFVVQIRRLSGILVG